VISEDFLKMDGVFHDVLLIVAFSGHLLIPKAIREITTSPTVSSFSLSLVCCCEGFEKCGWLSWCLVDVVFWGSLNGLEDGRVEVCGYLWLCCLLQLSWVARLEMTFAFETLV